MPWIPTDEEQQWLREKFVYEPDTGRIIAATTNLEVGFVKKRGYRAVSVCSAKFNLNKQLTAHRLAWFLYHGKWPTVEIDHVNHDKLDNRLENLRLATTQQNHGNRLKKPGCTSRFKGVYWHKQANKWAAQITCDYITKGLGHFDSEEEAAAAYVEAAASHFGEFAHVKPVTLLLAERLT